MRAKEAERREKRVRGNVFFFVEVSVIPGVANSSCILCPLEAVRLYSTVSKWTFLYLLRIMYNHASSVRLQGDQEGLADHQQHRHHEGRSQGVLVRPHRRVPVLVQG